MVRRKNQTLFLDATEDTTISQVKKMLEAILKRPHDQQQLYRIDNKEPLVDNKTLGDSGYKGSVAKAQEPGGIGLRFKDGG